MLKKELILKDPLSFLGYETDKPQKTGEFGAVMSRAGVGKTAFLVQIALSHLLKDKKVLHASIQDPVDKVSLWYKEMFSNLTEKYNSKDSNELWEILITNRFIMTFETESFDFLKLSNRIKELTAQNIFSPDIIILDGLSIDRPITDELKQFKEIATKNNYTIWFSIRTHRHQSLDPLSTIKQICGHDSDLFNSVIQLLPEKDIIKVKRLFFDREAKTPLTLIIDPSTMMIKEFLKT